jgi:SAM-dependent methyltransferase
MTDWDAALYLKFEQERTRPAIDLLARISIDNPRTCVDIGCGPGNSTELLVNRFPEANITGLDQSPGMLAAAKLRLPHVDFEQIDLSHWRPGRPYDIIFASGSLQWLPDHEALFPRLCFQIPSVPTFHNRAATPSGVGSLRACLRQHPFAPGALDRAALFHRLKRIGKRPAAHLPLRRPQLFGEFGERKSAGPFQDLRG